MEKRQDSLDDLVSTVKVLADREKRVENDVSEIKDDVKEMKERPTKRLDGIVDKIIYTIIGGIVGYILIKLGL